MRDQSYISGVARVVEETGKKLVSEKLLAPGAAVAGGGGGRAREDKSEKLVQEARKEGVSLMRLPKEMSRRVKNSSRWDHKEKRMEWTVEVVFRPPPAKDPSAPPREAQTISPPAQGSSATLYAVLKATLDSKDKKGKGKELSDEERDWLAKERAWLAANAPPLPAVATTVAEPAEASMTSGEVTATAPNPSISAPTPAPDDSFTLLLAPPLVPSTSSSDPDDAPPPPPSRPAPRALHPLTLTSTLSEALNSTPVLEFPTLELWSSEALLRARAKGLVSVGPKPVLRVPLPEQRGNVGESSRGRGAGRGGRGRGGGRGGAATSGGGREERWEDSGRAQDSGWGKRGAQELEVELEGEGGKRVRIELELAFEDPAPSGGGDAVEAYEPLLIEQTSEGGSGLVSYGSDSD
ncbi:hypothetical protein RQP46_001149 [Phenoliferia psychrophenolica]